MLYGPRPLTQNEINKILNFIRPSTTLSSPRIIKPVSFVHDLGSSTYSSKWKDESDAMRGDLEASLAVVAGGGIIYTPNMIKALAHPVWGPRVRSTLHMEMLMKEHEMVFGRTRFQ